MEINLSKRLPNNVFDYNLLSDHLKNYGNPRDKTTRLLADKSIVRVKKGLYVLGEDLRQGPIQLEALANLIYGPSYVSYEYALQYYGLIPEAVYQVTSATTQKTKQFDTPVGRFSYQHISTPAYATGICLVGPETQQFLIASPEKALCDKLMQMKNISNEDELLQLLTEDLRIDSAQIAKLRVTQISEIAQAYKSQMLEFLATLIRRIA